LTEWSCSPSKQRIWLTRVFCWCYYVEVVSVHSMLSSTPSYTSSCTSTMHCRPLVLAIRSTSGGRSTWLLCRLYVCLCSCSD